MKVFSFLITLTFLALISLPLIEKDRFKTVAIMLIMFAILGHNIKGYSAAGWGVFYGSIAFFILIISVAVWVVITWRMTKLF